MNSHLGAAIDRAVERARDKALDDLIPGCPECGAEMVHDWGEVWDCPECKVRVEFYEPDEGDPYGGHVVTHSKDRDA